MSRIKILIQIMFLVLRRPSLITPYIKEGYLIKVGRKLLINDDVYFQRALGILKAKDGPSVYRVTLNEKGKVLEGRHPGITNPVGIYQASSIEQKVQSPRVSVVRRTDKTINVFLPHFEPLIMFGGYISIIQFMRRLVESGYRVRIFVCEAKSYDFEGVAKKFSTQLAIGEALRQISISLVDRSESIEIGENDEFVAYSVGTAHLAKEVAETVGKRFFFFIQEYEPIFTGNNSFHALGVQAYGFPHHAIFNTAILERYFARHEIGVFSRNFRGADVDPGTSLVFQHALVDIKPPAVTDLKNRGPRRLLFYARPEAHAERNLFEIGLVALRRAVAEGVFVGDDWEFVGVGTLGTEARIDLGEGCNLVLTSSLPIDDYASALKTFDVGVSLMYAPHPSIIPFEMALAGMRVVTNTFENRSKEDLFQISRNLVACEPTIDGVLDALKRAVKIVGDYEDRIEGSSIEWSKDWNESFNDRFMERVADHFTDNEGLKV